MIIVDSRAELISENLTKRALGQSDASLLRQDTQRRNGAHDAVERGRMGSGFPRKFIGAPRPFDT